MELVEIGRTGRPHGIKGELGLQVEEVYLDDLLRAKAVLIGDPAIPYFVKNYREGGKLTVLLDTFTTREQVSLLSGKPLWLPQHQVTAEVDELVTPWDALLGYRIEAEGYPLLGPIEDIMDLPQHYLAEVPYEGKTLYIPLHENLVVAVREDDEVVVMNLPDGLLELAG
ncbi:Ribosome maturation factor RimM [Neolewinella maritima]|uniref:Ribosome maturation factor RimM n=1 Tax=Neolewinella maritima TaxID=1383882 RepID=A0ABM9B0D0_9BACT|nr:hypothetical protein [Neolewinella maritima]CAH1000421.1 Ribosome maturation factor RimM [Neolewinella maritima]